MGLRAAARAKLEQPLGSSMRRLPEVSSAAIAALDDAAITIEFSRAVTKPRLGVDPIEIPGAHSPFLARPGELADLLDQLTS